MKVLLLGGGSVGHTQRWANGLVEAGVQVLCVSQHDFLPTGWHPSVERVRLSHSGSFGYLLNAPEVARLYRTQRCTLLNAHYATGYGLLGTLSGVRPRLVSVWGSDAFDFPRKSPLHAAMLRQVLIRADMLASTSRVMAEQVRQLMGARWEGKVALTPFGVDTGVFQPVPPRSMVADAQPTLVIGTVKMLAPKYGIDTLLNAFAQLLRRPVSTDAQQRLVLRLVGDGPQRAELEALSGSLGIAAQVEFVGAVPHAEVTTWLHGFDVFVAASRLDSESFGVAVVEASACELPVVVTRVGGLPEVVDDGRTGLIVEREDSAALARALALLVDDAALRRRLGRAGRVRVRRDYEWRDCVQQMLRCYRQCVDGR